MTEEALFDLLEEARNVCGKKAAMLAGFLGARIPNDNLETRAFVVRAIHQYTGKHVTLPEHEDEFHLCSDCPRPDTCREATRCMCSQIKKFEGPDAVVKQSGQIDEKLTIEHSGCYWCPREDTISNNHPKPGHRVCARCHETRCRRCGNLLGWCECATVVCEMCCRRFGVGQSPRCLDGHDYVSGYHPFTPYFDVGLGREVTSLADRWQGMKAQPPDEFTEGRPKLEYRDHPTKGELAARKDRAMQRRKAQGLRT